MGQSSFAFAQEITSRRLHLDPRHNAPHAWHPARQNILRQTILTRVLPRMAANRSVRHLPIGPTSVVEVSVEQVVEFADLVSTGAVSTLVTHIEALQSAGISMNTLLIELVSPTARRFGDLWTKDLMSSVDVTAGMCRLQSVMRSIGPNFEAGGARPRFNKRILLAPAFGEHHILGLTMVAAFFRRAGWEVVFEPRLAVDDLLALVRVERFAAIGFSVATDKGLTAVRSQVAHIRNASLAVDVALIAGGPAFLDGTVDAASLGIDGVAGDATDAVRLAESATSNSRGVR